MKSNEHAGQIRNGDIVCFVTYCERAGYLARRHCLPGKGYALLLSMPRPPEAGDRERRTFAGIRAGYQTQLWYYDCPSTVLNLLEEFERELESDPVIFQFIEPDEGGDVEDMVTETVSDFSVAGFDWHP